MEEEEDDGQWTIDNLVTSDAQAIPGPAATVRLIREFRDRWTVDGLQMTTLMPWLCERFDLDPADFHFDTLHLAVMKEMIKLQKLKAGFQQHNLDDDPEMEKMLATASSAVAGILGTVGNVNLLIHNLSSSSNLTSLPVELRDSNARDKANETILNYDPSKNTAFQNLILYLRSTLLGYNLRRASGKFFKRIKCKGVEMLAFEEECTVQHFVTEHVSEDTYFQPFKWATSPANNFENAVKYLTERRLAVAPDLHENLHLRSYAGDEFGRGMGTYNSRTDMFFPALDRDLWPQMAEAVQRVRRSRPGGSKDYVCTAPDPSEDVCVVHLEAAFPYDIYWEVVQDLGPVAPHLRWREVDVRELPRRSTRLDHPELGALLADRLPVDAPDRVFRVGRVWHATPLPGRVRYERLLDKLRAGQYYFADEELEDDVPPDAYVDSSVAHPLTWVQEERVGGEPWLHPAAERLAARLAGALVTLTDDEWRRLVDGDVDLRGSHYVDAFNGKRYYPRTSPEWRMPFLVPPMRPRAVLTEEEWHAVACRVPYTEDGCHVLSPDGLRAFAPDAGRDWTDCETPEIDHIYECQKFTRYDCFFLYGLKGRLFYEVGELDTHQLTVMWLGIAGSGKSTVLKALMVFWPLHLRGVLSSNMQPTFGMASVLVDEYDNRQYAVAFCTEVSSEINLPQEEWQDATERTELSLNRKFKSTIKIVSKAQFAWAGNSRPRNWKNGQGQVSRRLAGVSMNYPVKPRDGSIQRKIQAGSGALQRRVNLAYLAFVRATGDVDPMSQVDKLPPAFAEFYRKGRRETDPIEDFLSEGTFVKVERDAEMPMSRFKELYNEYRLKYEMGKAIGMKEDVYRTPFAERGILVERRPTYVDDDGETLTNVDVIVHLAAIV